jgi:spore coat polysaccharide biosynthesis protein SpsF (cytidylyltransferase family)
LTADYASRYSPLTTGWREVRNVTQFELIYKATSVLRSLEAQRLNRTPAKYSGAFLPADMLQDCRVWLRAGEDYVFHAIVYQRFQPDGVQVVRERLIDVIAEGEAVGNERPPVGIVSIRQIFDEAQTINVDRVINLPTAVVVLMQDGPWNSQGLYS